MEDLPSDIGNWNIDSIKDLVVDHVEICNCCPFHNALASDACMAFHII
jgi:hypothetical protein